MLKADQAIEQGKILYEYHETEREELNVIRRYWKGRQRLPAVIPIGSPAEVRVMARSSRVNVLPIVVSSLVQSSFVDGFRAADDDNDLDVWKVWQANRMDARQTAIHRAAAAYGCAYMVVVPGDPVPVMRAVSPRSMTVLYGEDTDWPMWGLERLGHGLFKLYDEQAAYYLRQGEKDAWEFIEAREYVNGAGVVPIVRFLDELDVDDDDEVESQVQALGSEETCITRGQIAPLMPLQDQIDLTTFGLHIAQHYGAFKQRYIIGWTAENERETMKTSAMKFLTLDSNPDDVKVGEWDQTDLGGFIQSREASIRHAAALSQTPAHELIGELINMSAEALAAAEAGKDRKVGERHTNWGESHEQAFWLVGQMSDTRIDVPEDAQVVWRETSARSFAATVDALGKLATMLGVPRQELWERIPGVTKQDVERFKATAQSGDAFDQLQNLLERQANNPNG